MNPVSQPNDSPPQPQFAPAAPTPAAIDVVSAPAQSIPVRQVTSIDQVSNQPSQPAATPAASDHQPAPTKKTSRGLKKFWPAAVALVVACVLAGAAAYAFKNSNKPADNSPAQTNTAAAAPVTSSDIDKLSQTVGNLSNLNDTQDFSADALNDQALGL